MRIQRSLCGILLLFAVCSLGYSQLISRAVPPAAAVERGAKTFVATCGFCHGASARGGEGGPNLVRSPLVLDDENGDKIGPVILEGRPQKGMPKFDLTKDQIMDLAAFLRSQTQLAINRRAYQTQNLVTGNAKLGQEYFHAHCESCHSDSKDLAGIANRMTPEALQERFLYPNPPPRPGASSSSGSAKVTATLKFSSGQSVSGTLEFLNDFDVALIDSAGQYRSYPRAADMSVEIQNPLAGHEDLLRQYTDADMHNILSYLETLK